MKTVERDFRLMAKLIGLGVIQFVEGVGSTAPHLMIKRGTRECNWDPRNNPADVFELARKLSIEIDGDNPCIIHAKICEETATNEYKYYLAYSVLHTAFRSEDVGDYYDEVVMSSNPWVAYAAAVVGVARFKAERLFGELPEFKQG
jgi:hypothetical protein